MPDLTPAEFKAQLKPMTQIIGIDYGVKRIGVAVSDLMRMTATPLKIVANMAELQKLIAEREVGGFVIGLPRLMNGQEGEQLKERIDLPVLFWDERLSSKAVTRIFVEQVDLSRKRQKEITDKVAAAYILQNALDLLANI